MDYHVETFEELVKTEWFAGMMQEISALLQECKEQEKAALKVCEEPDGPYFLRCSAGTGSGADRRGWNRSWRGWCRQHQNQSSLWHLQKWNRPLRKMLSKPFAARVQGISYARMAPKRMTACRQKSGSWSRR